MKYDEVPESTLIGKASSISSLFLILAHASDDRAAAFTHIGRALGGPRSCRILLKEKIEGISEVALTRPLNYCTATMELMRLASSEARFDPPNCPGDSMRKGWEVRRAARDGKKFLVLFADWVCLDEERKYVSEAMEALSSSAAI